MDIYTELHYIYRKFVVKAEYLELRSKVGNQVSQAKARKGGETSASCVLEAENWQQFGRKIL